jgi:hypothetical protein
MSAPASLRVATPRSISKLFFRGRESAPDLSRAGYRFTRELPSRTGR